jgi:hypothetical protein
VPNYNSSCYCTLFEETANVPPEAFISVANMATKREVEDQDSDAPQPQTKRAKTHGSKTRQHQNSGIDPTWGQKYVFSSSRDATTIPEGEESDFEDDSDAMAYLMSVR